MFLPFEKITGSPRNVYPKKDAEFWSNHQQNNRGRHYTCPSGGPAGDADDRATTLRVSTPKQLLHIHRSFGPACPPTPHFQCLAIRCGTLCIACDPIPFPLFGVKACLLYVLYITR